MCEFNQRMVMPPRSCHSETELTIPIERPAPWAGRAAQLPEAEVEVIEAALAEAVELECDVHLYRRIGSRFLGLALQPSQYNKSMIIEHPSQR